ncbi:hypothetical protein FACS189449_08040 [Alphaproteobacteria bacterium]|nr:hypothetical protein FACS189449_08040 [Alphaproteobacteria bacterium]
MLEEILRLFAPPDKSSMPLAEELLEEVALSEETLGLFASSGTSSADWAGSHPSTPSLTSFGEGTLGGTSSSSESSSPLELKRELVSISQDRSEVVLP